MGFVLGHQNGQGAKSGDPFPRDSKIVREVLLGCKAHSDLYPTIASLGKKALMGTIPTATIEVAGQENGGQYWSDTRYEVVLTDLGDGEASIQLETASGDVIQTLTLSSEAVRDALDVLDRYEGSDVPGLSVTPIWALGDDRNQVTLRNDLDEVREWLKYVAGDQQWDADEPEWSY